MADTKGRPHNPDLPFVPCDEVSLDWFDTAPIRFVNQITLPVTPNRLFEIFEDPASWAKWGTGIGSVEWTSPKPYRPHTTRTVTFWGGMKVYEDFFVYSPPTEMAFCLYGTTESVWRSFGEHYLVKPVGEDQSHLTWTVAYEPVGNFARIHPLIKPVMAVNLRSYMWRLKRYCTRVK